MLELQAVDSPAIARPTQALSRLQLGLLIAGGLGLLARIVLTLLSHGSNDVNYWQDFAVYIGEHGLSEAYGHMIGLPDRPLLNHPPLAAYLASLSYEIFRVTHIRFAVLLKVPGLIGEGVTIWVLWRMWQRVSTTAAATAVAAYGFALCPILITAFHGNTDGLPAAMMLLSVYFATEKRPFAAGAALALAINIKIIPLIVIPAIFLSYRERKEVVRFVAGLSLAILPFIPFLFTAPGDLVRNVFKYTPGANLWGLQAFFIGAQQDKGLAELAAPLAAGYLAAFRYLFVAAVIAAAIYARRRRWPVERAAVVPVAAFLILTPGFGIQYTTMVCPLLFAVSVRWGALWASLTGTFAFLVYYSFRSDTVLPGTNISMPWGSELRGLFPLEAALFGVIAWAALIQFVVLLFLSNRRPSLDAT